jgi:hypothetical protein
LLLHEAVVRLDGFDDFAQIGAPVWGDNLDLARELVVQVQVRLPIQVELARDRVDEQGVERVDPWVVELGGDGAHDGHLLKGAVPEPMAALVLLADIAQGILRAEAVEFVDGDQVGVVQDVDLLQLARGAVLGGHHVEDHIDDVNDAGVALPDAGGLHDDEVEASSFGDVDGGADIAVERHVGFARGK